MRAGGQGEVQGRREDGVAAVGVHGWGDQGHVFESEAFVAEVDGPLDVGEGVRGGEGVSGGIVGRGVHAVEGRDKSVDAGGVACELGEVFETVHHS